MYIDTPRPVKAQPESFGHLYKDDVAVFNVQVHSGKQLRHFKYATVNLLVSLFSNADFVSQVCYIFCSHFEMDFVPFVEENFQLLFPFYYLYYFMFKISF